MSASGQALAVSLLVLALVVLVLAWVSSYPRRMARRRLRRAQVGEEQAAQLLEQAGYTVLAAQHEGSLTALVDEKPCSFALRADYLVRSRDGRLLIAEVKTGAVARTLQHGPTRRQLLEYALAYGELADGVLLVAPEQEQAITQVAFPLLRTRAQSWLPPFLVGAAAGAGILAAVSRYLLICR